MSQLTSFEKVKFRNFQSFGQNWTELDLTLKGTTYIIGENLDEGGSSGAGKTTALSVVSYCLYDKIPSGVSKDKMVNTTNGKKNTSMEAEFHFSKDGNKYIIHRSRGQNTGVHLYENEKDITPASVSDVNAKIEELVGFSYNLFSQVVLFNGNSRPFLDLPVGEQRTLIEELFKITVLTRKAIALKKQTSETTKQIDMLKVLINQQEMQNEGYKKRLIEAQRRAVTWEDTHKAEIERQENLLHAIQNVDFDTEEQLHARITEIEKLLIESSSSARQLMVEKTAKLREKHPKFDECAKKQRDLDNLAKELTKFESELKHLMVSKCPYCLQDYAAAREKASKITEQRIIIEDTILTLTAEVTELKLEIENFSLDITSQVTEINKQLLEHEEGIKLLQAEATELKTVLSYKTYKDHVNAKSSITLIKNNLIKLKSEVNPHIDALDTLLSEGEIKIDYDTLNELVVLKEHQTFMGKLLTDKNSYVRKSLISTMTPFLNKRIGYYLEKLNLPHIVLFQPDMSCEISQLGRSLDHGNLSNGEKKRLNLALCFSFRDVLTYLHSKVSVLFTDEADGGSMDSNCVDLLIQLLKKKSLDDEISIFTISHRPEFEGRLDRTIIVRKEQGFSSLIIQTE